MEQRRITARRCGVCIAFFTCLFACGTAAGADEAKKVRPAAETRSPSPVGDADDICIWVHPEDPALSVVIGTDKKRGLDLYGLDGRHLHHIEHGRMNNVDLRYGFPLAGRKVDLVTASNKDGSRSIAVYVVDPQTRGLVDVASRPLKVGIKPYGLCMYHNLETGKFYVIVNSEKGEVEQWELFDNGQGKVDGRQVRQFQVGSRTEGCVCDDEYGHLYIGEENVGIWKYPADPGPTMEPARRLVDVLGPKGNLSRKLTHDIEGLTLYYGDEGRGYLIASSQGAGTFCVYRREGENEYLGKFRIVDDDASGIDGVTGTDGIDVCGAALGPLFPKGLFVAHDGGNRDGDKTNYKFVAWESIAQSFQPPLQVHSSWDPRKGQNRR